MIYLRLWCLAVALLLCSPQIHCRNVTHEDIRDAMLSLIHMFRSSEDKLERHEYREKGLGDQLKKLLVSVDKRQRALEPMKGMISRLDERLSNVETILLQKEEREKATQKKTNEALDEIQKSLQSLTTLVTKNPKPVGPSEESNLTTDDDLISSRLDATDAKLDAVKTEIQSLKNSLSKESLQGLCADKGPAESPFERHISEAEKLLTKYELKLSEYNVSNGSKVQTEFVPLSEVSLADEAWHSKMTEVMERQEKEVIKIQRLLSDAEGMWKDLPRRVDLQLATNQTLDALQRTAGELKDNDELSVTKIQSKIREMGDRLQKTNEDIQSSLTTGNAMTERAYSDVSRSYEILRTEVQSLTKNEHVLLETADNVVATKKRVDYGVHQILHEVGELINIQSMNLNKTVNNRLDSMEHAVIDTQAGALANLSAQVEAEMSQVWRQIGNMYQQLSATQTSLEKLAVQTEKYVNGTSTTLDDVKAKVGLITTRVMEIDDDLNHFLGQLSLVTHEFDAIKGGLQKALDSIKKNVHTVHEKLEDTGPGPHNITSAETTS